MKRSILFKRGLIGVIAFILLAGIMGQFSYAAADPTPDQLDNAISTTMMLWELDAKMKAIAGCSAVVVDPSGFVLTNFHCVGFVKGQEKQGKPGTLSNPQGLVYLGPTLDARKAPKPTYIGRFIAGNYITDVAVLKIVGMVNQKQALPDPLPLVSITLADSDQVRIGDYIAAIGYPGMGGDTVTVTDGKVAGFEDWSGTGTQDSFKVTTNIMHGNSGGLAIDSDGNQIGIPSNAMSDTQSGDKLSYVRMINVAVPYIQKAISVCQSATGEGSICSLPSSGSNNPPVNPPDNPPSNQKPTLGDITFGTDYQNDKLVGQATSFKSGISQVVGTFKYSGMGDGMDWGRTWAVDGQVIAGKTSGYVFDGGDSGNYRLSLYNDEGPLPDGSYKLSIYVEGSMVKQGAFQIGGTAPPPKQTPPPPPPSQNGVTLKGQVVDADTNEGIGNALFLIFKPGTTDDQIVAGIQGGSISSLLAAMATTDDSGNYQTAPPIARGKSYSVMVIADGYKIRYFSNGLEVKSNDPAILKMTAIALQAE